MHGTRLVGIGRRWSRHPCHLDASGLAALWRQGLPARAVPAGRTRGLSYRIKDARREPVDVLCFVGLDALRNADRRVRLLGLVCRAATPGYRGAVTENGRPVGHVTAAAWSPTLDQGIGYVRFDAADEWIGRSLQVQTEAGDTADCEIVALPFYDREKRIPRGLDRAIP